MSDTDRRNREIRAGMGISGALSQDVHAAINRKYPGLTREHCAFCDAETGRAGMGEDSLYSGEIGPYCVECWDDDVRTARI